MASTFDAEMSLFPAATTVLLAAVSIAFLCWRRDALRGTTLLAPWYWTLITLATLGLGEGLLTFDTGEASTGWAAAVRLISATCTFCPAMAVLGARRPQHHAWQFIVVTMWIMLALPAAEAVFLGRLQAMDIGPVRGWFLWLMLLVNLLTYLPTRFFFTAMLTAVGQFVLLRPYLPGVGDSQSSSLAVTLAMIIFSLAVVRTACGFPPPRETADPHDRRWLQFRDQFGTMWALRVLERINAAARMYDWPLSLSWTGYYFHKPEDDWQTLSPQIEQDLQQTVDNLLRRFL